MDAIQLTGDGLDEKFIRTLVDLGADVNFISEECWCPLADAIYAGRPTIVEFLLEKGANPNVVCDYSETVLELAEIDLDYNSIEAGDLDLPDGQRCTRRRLVTCDAPLAAAPGHGVRIDVIR